MVAEIAAAISVCGANLVNSSASNWGSADSGVAITIATIIVYCANLPNVLARVSNGTKKLGRS